LIFSPHGLNKVRRPKDSPSFAHDQRNLTGDEKNARKIEILRRRIRVASQSRADAAILDAILICRINLKLAARKHFKSF